EQLDRDYTFYWLLGIRNRLIETSFGGAQPNISQTVIRNLEIPWVPVPEQRRIAARLKAQLVEVDSARQAVQAGLRDADTLRQRLLHHAFDALADAPSVPLRDAADIVAGITLGRKTKETELINVPYMRVANVKDGELDTSDMKTVLATKREIEKLTLRDGDLLLTEGGDPDKLGRGACWRNQLPLCIHQNHIFRVRLPSDIYDPDFVSFQVGSPYGKAYFFAHAKKTTGIATINQGVLGAFPLLSPPLAEQRRIAAALKAQLAEADTLRTALQNQQRDLEALPQRILAQAFDGSMALLS
ncbi:MAG: restriction endonuclease subunit S, partial [Rhodocyclaceae bacterium]|nr:restriction endonuclease subunit S [Rhodocyclaceae bacterium]